MSLNAHGLQKAGCITARCGSKTSSLGRVMVYDENCAAVSGWSQSAWR